MQKQPVVRFFGIAASYLFWPALGIVIWGELDQGTSALEIEVWDKLLHFTAYFGLAGIATLATGESRKAILAPLGLIALGGLLEIVQGLVGRDMSIYDEFANCLGAASGYLAGCLLLWFVGKKLP
jgi:VanZ family protein